MQPPRKFLDIQIGEIQGLGAIRRLESLYEQQRPKNVCTDDDVEARFISGEVSDQLEARQKGHKRTRSSDAGGSEKYPSSYHHASKQLLNKVNEHAKLVNAIRKLCVVPLASTCEVKQWMDDPILSYFHKGDADYKRALEQVMRETCQLSFTDISNIIDDTEPIWYARTPDHYFSRQDSLDIMEDLISFQFKYDEDAINEFWQTLYNIMERKLPKMNSIYICGPPSAGKTYFSDAVLAYYMNVGHLGNFDKYTSFPLNDCVNRRVILWNEPSVCPSKWETVKMITGGDVCPAAVKFQNNAAVTKTPLIITSNDYNMFDHEAFKDRVRKYHWQACPMLKSCKRYLSPWAYHDIIMKRVINKEFE